MNFNFFRSAGFAAGLLIGLIIVVIIFKLANTNHKASTQYDERQQVIRGKGYMYGFYAMMIFEVAMMLLDMSELAVPVEPFILHFGAILVGILVLVSYTIWCGAYWGLNNNRRTYAIVMVIVGLVNAIPVISSIREGTFMKAGESSAPVINLLVLIMLVCVGVVTLIRHILDTRAEGEN